MNILFVLVIAGIITGLLLGLKYITAQSGDLTGFEGRGVLFSPTERSFLGVLEQALDSRYRVFGKVRLGDLIKPATALDAGKQNSRQNRINQQQLDFVICTANELAPVGVVELDDQTKGNEKAAKRDLFVEQALKMAGVPFLRFPANGGYTVQEVRTKLAEMMFANSRAGGVTFMKTNPAPVNSLTETAGVENTAADEQDPPACPKCAAVMVKRDVIGGRNAGKNFWVCPDFPRCREIMIIG